MHFINKPLSRPIKSNSVTISRSKDCFYFTFSLYFGNMKLNNCIMRFNAQPRKDCKQPVYECESVFPLTAARLTGEWELARARKMYFLINMQRIGSVSLLNDAIIKFALDAV